MTALRLRHAALLGLALVLLLTPACERGSFEGRCVAVRDGDSLEVLRQGRTVRIRLHGIDCPERGQPYSNAARKRTAELVQGKQVRVEVRDRDQYRRLVARVYIDDQDLSVLLVREGLAWHYTRYSSDPLLEVGQLEARRARVGLWQEPDPVPPWRFRRARRPRS